MVHQTRCCETEVSPAACEHGLLKNIGHQRGGLRRHHPPAQDPPREDINTERGVDEALQCPHVGEISDPPLIRPGRCTPLTLDQIRMPRRTRVCGRGHGVPLATHDSLDFADPHQPAHLVAAHLVTSVFHHMPHLADPVEPPVGHIQSMHGVGGVGLGPGGVADRAADFGRVVGGRGDRQAVLGEHGADRVDPEPVAVSVDVVDDHRIRRSTSAAAKNVVAVFKISLALRNSAFSLRNAVSSTAGSPDSSQGAASRTP